MITKWIENWFDENADVVFEITDAFQKRDRDAFLLALPERVEGWYSIPYDYKGEWNNPVDRNDIRLIVSYSTGGVSGGSCWESSNPQPYADNDRPEQGFVTTLAAHILESEPEVKISLVVAMTLARRFESLVRMAQDSIYEYYGNCTNYEYQFILGSELYDLLIELVDGKK